MDPQYFGPALYIGFWNHDIPVEPSGPQKGRVKDIRPVGGGDYYDALVGLESVHLDEELVQGLLPLVVASAKASAPVATDRVYLVYEYYAGRVLLALNKQVPDPGRADADEHLDEI